MLLFLALIATALANALPTCPGNAIWLDISGPGKGVYKCLGNQGNKRSEAKRAEAPRSTLSRTSHFQTPIDTLQGWNGVQLISPIGRSANGKPYSAQTFLSLARQNLETLTFAFRTTSSPPTALQIRTMIYQWDNVNNAPIGSPIWDSVGNADILFEAVKNWTYISYNVQGTSITLAEPPAPPVNQATVPINLGLQANTHYAVIFFSPTSAIEGTGAIAARQDNPTAYADGAYYWNNETASTTPVTGWESANPENDAAFRLTFSELLDCQGAWEANPYWAAQQNPGSPANCLETLCSDYPVTPQAGFLDEQYNVTQVATLNGNSCNASYGVNSLPLTNTIGVNYYRLFEACTQANPCVNCGPSVTGDCVRTAPQQSGVQCTAEAPITYPQVSVVSTTAPVAGYPVVSPPRIEQQTPPTATACPAPSTQNCPCVDCVTAWQDEGSCTAIECDSPLGLQNQTVIVVTAGSQDSVNPPQLFRECSVQTPAFPGAQRVNCSTAPITPCPHQPTE